MEEPAQIQPMGGEIVLDAQPQNQPQCEAERGERQRLADDHDGKLHRPQAQGRKETEFIAALEYSHENRVEYPQPDHRKHNTVHDVVEGVVQQEEVSQCRHGFPPREDFNRNSRQLLPQAPGHHQRVTLPFKEDRDLSDPAGDPEQRLGLRQLQLDDVGIDRLDTRAKDPAHPQESALHFSST